MLGFPFHSVLITLKYTNPFFSLFYSEYFVSMQISEMLLNFMDMTSFDPLLAANSMREYFLVVLYQSGDNKGKGAWSKSNLQCNGVIA